MNVCPLPVAPALAPPVPVGCQSEDDCPEYNSCRNRACVDPCAEDDPCSATANCRVVRHNVVCTCPDGYVGDPKTSCIRREYSSMKVATLIFPKLPGTSK